MVELSVGLDKNPKQVRTEIICKQAKRILSATYPSRRWFVDKDSGTLSTGWTEVLQIQVDDATSQPRLGWCHKHTALFGVDETAVAAEILAGVPQVDVAEYSF